MATLLNDLDAAAGDLALVLDDAAAFVADFAGAEFLVRASAETTGGGVTIIEEKDPLEAFFRELAAAEAAGGAGPEAYAAASERAGITWLS